MIVAVTYHIPSGRSNVNLPYSRPNTCKQSIENEMFIMKSAWVANLQSLMNQSKPTSQKVDEAYESLGTYRCWLSYVCQAVTFSGSYDGANLKNGQLTSEHIQPIAGCLPPEKLEIPNTFIKHMPLCQIEASNTRLADIQANVDVCQQLLQFQFYKTSDSDPKASDTTKKVQQRSGAYIILERMLKTDNANQRGRTLAKKIDSISAQLLEMHSHMTLLREALHKFDSLIPCVINQCN